MIGGRPTAVGVALAFFAALACGEAAYAQSSDSGDDRDPATSRSNFPRISDDEETIYAVQRKTYLLKNKWELTPMFSYAFNDSFVETFGISGSVTYHVAEYFGIELYGGYMFGSESDLTEEIFVELRLNPEIAKLTKLVWAAGIGVQWSPIYGKIQMFDAYLGDFAFYVSAGIGLGQIRAPCIPGSELDPNRGFDPPTCPQQTGEVSATELPFLDAPATTKLMGSIGGGMRFNFSTQFGLKLEVRDYIFSQRVFRPESTEPTSRFTDTIRNYLFIQLGVTFLLGGEDN